MAQGAEYNQLFADRLIKNLKDNLADKIKSIKKINKVVVEKKHKQFYKQYQRKEYDDNKKSVYYTLPTNVGDLRRRNSYGEDDKVRDANQKNNLHTSKSKSKSKDRERERDDIYLNTHSNFCSKNYKNNSKYGNRAFNSSTNKFHNQVNMQSIESITGSSFYPSTVKKRAITSSNNFHPTQFNSNKDKFMTTTSNFNQTNSTISNFNKTNNLDFDHDQGHGYKLTEEDTNNLISLYHINKHGEAVNKDFFTKEERRDLLDKFKISKSKMNDKEVEALTLYLRKTHVNKNEYEKTLHKFNKTEYSSTPYFFKDPYKSLNKLKQNSQIFETMMNFRTDEQIECYRSHYKEKIDNEVKISKMPVIHESKSIKAKLKYLISASIIPEEMIGRNMSMKSKTSNLNIVPVDQDNALANKSFNKVKLENDRLLSTGQISRDQLLEKVELQVTYDSPKIKPTARNQFTLSYDSVNVYLFGGVNSIRLNDIWIWNIKENKWRTVSFSREDAPVPRSGHTAVTYKKEIFIYGGLTPLDYFKPREDILIFSTLVNKFYAERTYNRSEAGWRRNHVAVVVGSSMFVHGGIDENQMIISEATVFDIPKLQWGRLEYRGESPPALAHHTALLVTEMDITNPSWNIYKAPDIAGRNNFKKIRYEGIYLFGGLDENDNFTNDLRILRVGKKQCDWINPLIHGIPPCGRINTSVNLYRDLNLLVVHGGRNDKERKIVLNDIFLLDLENLIWVRAEFQSNVPMDRTEHGAVVNKNNLIILGGNNGKTFNNFEFCVVQLDLLSKFKNKGDKDNKENKEENNIKNSAANNKEKRHEFVSKVSLDFNIIPRLDINKLNKII